ncbi:MULTISPECIES: type IV-A pilus assembly ATPase PilB [unclassified Limnobacter]|uniref:type IV-A pilus assembly ATPase PilB n=1 Tax=unclassified Limnobacter TaxID=2630203 RepID=UPI000C643088|nr:MULTISPECIES: type IV-A pilus assembly ATPase PilB [unclassified Limnobacter]MAG82108.1 type IV-A pilus assembly ATPase PilB [Sutterellaceae bacterium]MBT84719.1 type IV-A pilus assembly ATPase PilB [Sutterellaceae bacterium]|tara:strand:+ start:3857 stop:5554 length:1698 start_codon:yes stop_codon:yes gene_type:complete
MSISSAIVKSSGLVRALTAKGIMDNAQLEQLTAEEAQGRSVAEWIVNNGLVSAELLASTVAQHFGYPLLDLSQFDDTREGIEADLIQAEKGLEAFVLNRRHGSLSVAMADPTDLSTIQQLKFRTQLQVEPVVVEYDKLLSRIEKNDPSQGMDEGLLTEVESDANSSNNEETSPDVDDAPIVRFVQRVLSDAMKKGASDIHFEPYEKSYRVRFRIDGVLQETSQPPLAAKSKIAARIKIMSRLNTTETRIPQDGRIRLTLGADERKIDFRVSTLPTLFGEKIVMRLLDSSKSLLKLEQLGFDNTQRLAVEKALAKPHGMILVTGPTGSGKTVSLYTFLQMLNNDSINISTVEDPAEINLPGINQVNINERIGLTFAKALRALLRQDPDVIMVGEIRDLETADISIKASQTGHKVLSTLHTNDAVSSIIRLKNMGVETFNISSSVSLIIAQRLVRKLCNCKSPNPLGLQALTTSGLLKEVPQEDWTPFCAVGCEACNGTGYSGRTGIYEVLPVSEAMQELIISGASALDLERLARQEGIASMSESGVAKIRLGITSIEEILGATKAD